MNNREYAVITCCADGRQLTGSGYKSCAAALNAIAERMRYTSDDNIVTFFVIGPDARCTQINRTGLYSEPHVIESWQDADAYFERRDNPDNVSARVVRLAGNR